MPAVACRPVPGSSGIQQARVWRSSRDLAGDVLDEQDLHFAYQETEDGTH